MPPGPPPLPAETKQQRGTFRPHRDGPEKHIFDDLPSDHVEMPTDLEGDAAIVWEVPE